MKRRQENLRTWRPDPKDSREILQRMSLERGTKARPGLRMLRLVSPHGYARFQLDKNHRRTCGRCWRRYVRGPIDKLPGVPKETPRPRAPLPSVPSKPERSGWIDRAAKWTKRKFGNLWRKS